MRDVVGAGVHPQVLPRTSAAPLSLLRQARLCALLARVVPQRDPGVRVLGQGAAVQGLLQYDVNAITPLFTARGAALLHGLPARLHHLSHALVVLLFVLLVETRSLGVGG